MQQVIIYTHIKNFFNNTKRFFKMLAGHWWFMPLILATWESEIRRITVQGHPQQIVCETPSAEQNGLEVWLKQ
jgi:hypothetical protein